MSESALPLPAGMQVFQRGWLSSNNILFTGREHTALVDTGYLTHAPQTLALVQYALQGRKLDQIINTHLHSDHCGGNALLQSAYDCHTMVPAPEADKVRQWDQEALSFRATGQQCERFAISGTIAPGATLRLGDLDWQALAAPGHDPHSLMYFCPAEGILLSADALWENGFGVIFPELEGESGFAEARATLDLITRLAPRLVIPGHGAPFADVPAALARAISRIDFFMADPHRNAQYALKVLLKFLLMERQRIALDDIGSVLAAARLFARANQVWLQLPPEQLAQWVVEQLLRTGSARIEGEWLINAG